MDLPKSLEDLSKSRRILKFLNEIYQLGRNLAVDQEPINVSVSNRLTELFQDAFLWIRNATSEFETEGEYQVSWILLDLLLPLGLLTLPFQLRET